ncbi:hypothetical protein ACSBR2_018327 [Camellia fascicularis]
MALKRLLSFKVDDDGSRESKRRFTFATCGVTRDVMRGFSLHEFATMFEPLLRRVVRDEVECTIPRFYHSSPRSSLNQLEPSQSRNWQLHFDDKLPSKLFTGSRIESEDSKTIKIVILDAISKKIVTSGPLSSVKVEIVALDGDFRADGQEDWTEEEFNANVVREREGKRPLVIGELVITLRDGVGYVADVSFTDNSSWIRGRKFRLGARTVQSISTDVRIREARSEAFVVKDQRGESYKKHHPPNLVDEIWRLEKIAKDGAFHKKLADNGITTVGEFLKFYHVDQSSLRNILGCGISNKIWETIIEHATACVLDDKLYIYYRDVERVGLVFNSIYKLVGVINDGQNYQSLDKLNVFQMGLVENLKKHAYKNVSDWVPLDEASAFGPAMLVDPVSSLQPVSFHQDPLEMQLASNHMMSLQPYTYDAQDGSQLEVSAAQHYQPMQLFTPALGNCLMAADSCSGPYVGGDSWAPSGSLGSLMQIGHLTANDNSQEQKPTWHGNGLFFAPNNETVGILSSNFDIHISRNGKPKARWCMIRAAMKWGISVRRDVEAKKWQSFLI